ncbi:MAG: MFS transporter [Kiloniellales bacterium]|nr:MFS transporter [Kiloniellales bacterium]
MTAAVAPVAALLLSVAFLLMGNGLQGTLLPVRASLESFGALEIGLLGSSYFVGFAIGCLYGPHVVRRAGHIRTFTAMVAIASCIVLGHALVVEAVSWWLMRSATGFCFAVLYMVIESWLNEKSTNQNRGLVFSIYTIINLTVITLGQLMLILDEPGDFPLFALASILVSLAAVPVALTTAEAPAPIAAVKIRITHLYRLSPVGVVGCLAVGMANGSFWALGPVFAQGDGGSTADVALFMSITVIAGAVGQWPLGRLSDRMDRRKVIVAASLGAALAGIGMVGLALTWHQGILATAFLFGLFAFPLYALSVAHMNDFVQPEGYLEAAGGLLLVFAVGAVAGPLVASLVVRYVGIDSLFAYTTCVHLMVAAFAVYRMRRRAPTPQAEHILFADALRVAQTVSNVDPLSQATESEEDHQTGTLAEKDKPAKAPE